MSNNTTNANEPINRERVLKQREGLQATLDRLRHQVSFYEGTITSLDYLLEPEKFAQPITETDE